ncbi:hypothetical protein GCM10027018_04100 [Paenibacillus thermoaerophilus]
MLRAAAADGGPGPAIADAGSRKRPAGAQSVRRTADHGYKYLGETEEAFYSYFYYTRKGTKTFGKSDSEHVRAN